MKIEKVPMNIDCANFLHQKKLLHFLPQDIHLHYILLSHHFAWRITNIITE